MAGITTKLLRRGCAAVCDLAVLPCKRKHRLVRYAMYKALEDLQNHSEGVQSVLSVSGSERMADAFGIDRTCLTSVDYPEVSLLDLPFDDNSFDAILADQVLEHIEGDPLRAIEESFRVVRLGGLVAHATCFMNPHHCVPNDYWRFSEYGLRELFKGREILACGSWGNFFALAMIYCGARSVLVPEAKWHPVNWIARRQEKSWPITTWIIARKDL